MTDKNSLNGWQRYYGVLRGGKVDFLPRTPILMQYAAEYIGSDYGRFAADYRVLVEANAACARDFGMDQVSCISDPYRETQGFGGEVVYVPDGPPRCSHPLHERQKFVATAQTNSPARGTHARPHPGGGDVSQAVQVPNPQLALSQGEKVQPQ